MAVFLLLFLRFFFVFFFLNLDLFFFLFLFLFFLLRERGKEEMEEIERALYFLGSHEQFVEENDSIENWFSIDSSNSPFSKGMKEMEREKERFGIREMVSVQEILEKNCQTEKFFDFLVRHIRLEIEEEQNEKEKEELKRELVQKLSLKQKLFLSDKDVLIRAKLSSSSSSLSIISCEVRGLEESELFGKERPFLFTESGVVLSSSSSSRNPLLLNLLGFVFECLGFRLCSSLPSPLSLHADDFLPVGFYFSRFSLFFDDFFLFVFSHFLSCLFLLRSFPLFYW